MKCLFSLLNWTSQVLLVFREVCWTTRRYEPRLFLLPAPFQEGLSGAVLRAPCYHEYCLKSKGIHFTCLVASIYVLRLLWDYGFRCITDVNLITRRLLFCNIFFCFVYRPWFCNLEVIACGISHLILAFISFILCFINQIKKILLEHAFCCWRLICCSLMSFLVFFLPPSGCLDPENFRKFKLVEKTQISHNVAKFRFALPTPTSALGLPIGQHISCRFEFCVVPEFPSLLL